MPGCQAEAIAEGIFYFFILGSPPVASSPFYFFLSLAEMFTRMQDDEVCECNRRVDGINGVSALSLDV